MGACRCPGTPHPDGDTVYLRPKLGLAAGIAVQAAGRGGQAEAAWTRPSITGLLAESYLLVGVAGLEPCRRSTASPAGHPDTIQYRAAR